MSDAGPSRRSVLLVGAHEPGLAVARALHDRGHQVVVIDRDPAACARLSDEWIATVIEGDATDPEVFAQATPAAQDAVVALTGDIETDLTVCALAKALDGAGTVCRVRAAETVAEDFADVDAVVDDPADTRAVVAAVEDVLSSKAPDT